MLLWLFLDLPIVASTRLRKVLSAMVSEESATGSGSVSSLSDGFKLTYLEVEFSILNIFQFS